MLPTTSSPYLRDQQLARFVMQPVRQPLGDLLGLDRIAQLREQLGKARRISRRSRADTQPRLLVHVLSMPLVADAHLTHGNS